MMVKVFTRLLRIFFSLLYNQLAITYDLIASVVSFGAWRAWVLAIRGMIEPGKVLEIGFGPGYLQVDLLQGNSEIYGIDLSRTMARLARKRILKSNLTPQISVADGIKTPFQNQIFDQIAATFPTEYFFSDDALAEFNRILKPGGELIVLPTAIITGTKLRHRILASIYRITGQTVKESHQLEATLHTRFSRHGFFPKTHYLEKDFYSLLMIHAQKQS